MSDIIVEVTRASARKPGKTLLQTLVVAAGALAFSAGLTMSGSIKALERETYQYRVSVSAGETDEAGRFEYQRPSPFTADIIERLAKESGYITKTAPVSRSNWPAVRVGASRFSIRSVSAAGADYPDIMGLKLLDGRWFTPEESDNGDRVAIISRSVALALFSSVSDAVEASIDTERGMLRVRQDQNSGETTRLATEKFTVIGVYEDPSEISRAALGIPDTVIPFGAARPPGMTFMPPIQVFVAKTDGTSPAALEGKIRSSLSTFGAEDAPIAAWEGNPSTPNARGAAEVRKTLSSLAGALSGLGALILIVSAFGIYTSTSMEAADGRKGTSIRRALGETSMGTIMRFTGANVVFGSVAATFGAILSIPAYEALARAVESLLSTSGLGDGKIFPLIPLLWPPLAAIAATSLACGLFALPAAISASRASIVEGIQEL